MAKKYYWLKLQKDFFKRHDIRIIESMPNGKDYILFYLKLLVESVSHEGSLRFSDTVPYNLEMLATITNTNVDIVRSAVKIFEELNLMETLEDETIYMNEVTKMVGSETEWAKKKRQYRLEHKEDIVPEMSGQKNTKSDKSKSKELDKEKELKKDINIPTGISERLDSKLKEFIQYRKQIKKPIKTDRPINSLINNIGKEFVNEDHLIQCIDYVMDHEWQGVKGEYVEYKPPKRKIKTTDYDFGKNKETDEPMVQFKPGDLMKKAIKNKKVN